MKNKNAVLLSAACAAALISLVAVWLAFAAFASATRARPDASLSFDVVIRNGHILDGSGNPWYAADVGIRGDRIATVGNLSDAHATRTMDASGQIVAPGFIDVLGQSEMALLIDNRALSKLSQGITSEVTGEGQSIAPQNEKTIAALKPVLDHYHLTVDWTSLDGYFQRLQKQGTPLNLGTFVGAAQVREAVIGDDDRAPTPAELGQMKALVDAAMKDGALGVSTALIYPPGHYAKTEELIALSKVAAPYGGIYATHMRSEGAREMEAIDEAIRIGREAALPVEIFHLKVIGKTRWGSMPRVVEKIQAARDSGLDIRADQYPYVAGGTTLASALPPWVADGGLSKLLDRLRDPKTRQRIETEMTSDHTDWENLYFESGGGSGVMVASADSPALKQYQGQTLAQIAKAQGKDELDAMFDFILEDKGQTGALYFIADENDLRYGLKQPWVEIGLDASEMPLDGPIFEPHTHPRAFGSMPRFLGRYVRDERLLPLPEAIRKITSMPAQRYHLTNRGLIQPGFYADITVFNPHTIIDRATYEQPTLLSEGIDCVLVNGKIEYENGKLTGVNAGRPLRGMGAHQAVASQ